MRELIIGFSTNKSPYNLISGAIRLAQRTNYSHVYIRTESDWWQRSLIYQASGISVNMMTLNVFEKDNKIIKEFRIQVDDEVYKEVVRYAMDQCGIGYGWTQLFGLGFVLFVEALTGKRISNPSKGGFICSELVARLLRQLEDTLNVEDFLIQNNLTYDTISPKDIDTLLSRYFPSNLLES